MPVNPKNFQYEFAPRVLVEIREKLGLSQAKLSQSLELPVNTISRWEREETTPDANSLAALYSIAKGAGLEPEFFHQRVNMAKSKGEKVESDFFEVIRKTGGRPVERINLGQSLRDILTKHGVKPEDMELSKNHPTRSLLTRLKQQNKIQVSQLPNNPESVSVKLCGASGASSAQNGRTRYLTIQRKGRDLFELTVVGKDGQEHKMEKDKKGKDGHFTDEGKYRRAIVRAVRENVR